MYTWIIVVYLVEADVELSFVVTYSGSEQPYSLGDIKNMMLRNKLNLNHDYDLSCVDHLHVRTGVPLSLKNYMFYEKLFLSTCIVS